MILKDLIFAFRTLRRNKLLAAINALGLSIGISACLTIFLIAHYELSFDRFQPDGDRIYRLYSTTSGVSGSANSGVPTGLPIAVREQFTGIESLTNFHTFAAKVEVPSGNGAAMNFGNHEKIIFAAPDYFEVFNYYQWVAGSPRQSLTEPFKVVITESRARTYFGDIHPISVIGKAIRYGDSLVVTVSGIVKDIKERTDLDFTDLISYSSIERSWLNENYFRLNSWRMINSNCQLFIKLASGTSRDKFETQLAQLTRKYRENNPDFEETFVPELQPLKDLHFNSRLWIFDYSRSVAEKSTLRLLIFVAALLLIIASINFINLETAQGARRSKEVGVRKVLGSSRQELIYRFLSESFVLCVLAVFLSVVWTELSFTYFSYYFPEGLVFDMTDPVITLFLISCIVVVTLLAGLYPAFVISSYRPALALKDLAYSTTGTSRSAFIRKGLTVFQFTVSQILIVATIVAASQLNYMLNKDLGFDPDAVVSVRTPWGGNREKCFTLKNELSQIPEIQALTLSGNQPLTAGYITQMMTFDNGKEVVRHNVHLKRGDTSYLGVYGIQLLAGRNLLPIDSAHELLINETYMRLLGFDQPRDMIGKTIDSIASVVGVVKDFHGQTLHREIKPTAISYGSDERNFGIKLFTPQNKVADLKSGLAKIEAAWKKIYPEEKFEYYFVDDMIQRYYKTEERTGKLASMATVIAILISCLGLFGLSSFTVIQRTKEIGIRKVLGATVNSILVLLSKDFLKLVIIAFVLSAPLSYYVSDWWLRRFAYKIDLNAWIFMISALFSVLIAFVTISFRTVSAAKSDPVKSLRYE